MSVIKYIKPENFSGYIPKNLNNIVQTIKKQDFIVISDFSVGGDAPKEFVKIYKYGRIKRENTKNWIKYIAKTGHKWYPNESISEHLLNCIGKELGLRMSNSELAFISGQLRFLSEYFLDNKQQELVHGVDIFAEYISDREFVEQIEQQQLAREFFTFQFAIKAIEVAFPKNYDEIVADFVQLLVFDAIVGNNDRHFYNWGVVRSINNTHRPYFSPIFDTARGLFWNESEQKISEKLKQKQQLNSFLNKYIKNSYPKTGWEGESNLNHVTLIEKLKKAGSKYENIVNELLSMKKEEKVLKIIQSNFFELLSVNRLTIVIECLKLRFQLLRDI